MIKTILMMMTYKRKGLASADDNCDNVTDRDYFHDVD